MNRRTNPPLKLMLSMLALDLVLSLTVIGAVLLAVTGFAYTLNQIVQAWQSL